MTRPLILDDNLVLAWLDEAREYKDIIRTLFLPLPQFPAIKWITALDLA